LKERKPKHDEVKKKMVEYVHGKTIRGVSGKIISTFIINFSLSIEICWFAVSSLLDPHNVN